MGDQLGGAPVPSETRGDTHLSMDTVREAMDYWIGQYQPQVRRFAPHDLRRTMKSHMRALGVPREISEMCLNHKLSGVEGTYDHTPATRRVGRRSRPGFGF